MDIIEITSANFDEVVASSDLLLIDFWAEWCGPCKAFAKVMEEVASSYPEFVFASINVDSEKQLAEEFEIRSIPAIMILRKQTVVYADAGALTRTTLIELLDQAKNLCA